MRHAILPGDPARPVFGRRRSVIERYVDRFDGAEVVRWSFRGLLVGAIALLSLNIRDLTVQQGLLPHWAAAFMTEDTGPLLPPVDEADLRNGTVDPRGNLRTDRAVLGKEMQFALADGNRLTATGSIHAGSAKAFEAALAENGRAVRTVTLDSPGGSLEDAIAMGRLVREKGLSTEVRDGGVCASSCPLFFAGGIERAAGSRAAMGLHQFYATSGSGNGVAAALSSAQATVARIGNYLVEMDVDPALWLHALDTPPQTLYYLTQKQQAQYRLVTTGSQQVAAVKSQN